MDSIKTRFQSSDTTPHQVFLVIFGIFGVLHWMIYAFWWQYGVYPTLHLVGISGLLLTFRPRSSIALAALAISLAMDGWLQAPVYSNHTMLKNFVVVGLAAAAAETLFRKENKEWFLRRFAPYGCAILLGMYFFGIFHKINTGFIDPEVSCAVALWNQMPLPDWAKASRALHYAGIYGIFIIEALIALCLLVYRLRHIGIIAGIAFHMMLASSSYEFYSAFTVLTVALHSLFLRADAHVRLLTDDRVRVAVDWLRTPLGIGVVALYFIALSFYTALGMVTSVGLGMFIASLPLAVAIWRNPGTSGRPFSLFSITSIWMPILVFLYFFNGFAPYIGIKTAQSFNMFANLHLEGGHSNHLILRNAPKHYLDDLVQVIDSKGIEWNFDTNDENLRMTYYAFLDRIDRSTGTIRVTYRLNDGRPLTSTKNQIQSEIDRMLHARWVRKWLHFNPVDLSSPKRCGINY